MTNFEKVVDFNNQFGVIKNKDLIPNENIFKTNPTEINNCMNLIREEVKELEKAVIESSYIETVDALTDILYVVYGMGCRIGINMDKAFKLVHDNNMSKLCMTEEEAKDSVQHYKNIEAKTPYKSPAYKKAPDDKHYVVYNESPYKVLKSIKYQPVDLTCVVKQ